VQVDVTTAVQTSAAVFSKPKTMVGQWYVIREYGHNTISPIFVMTATEIFETYGFQVEAWHRPLKV